MTTGDFLTSISTVRFTIVNECLIYCYVEFLKKLFENTNGVDVSATAFKHYLGLLATQILAEVDVDKDLPLDSYRPRLKKRCVGIRIMKFRNNADDFILHRWSWPQCSKRCNASRWKGCVVTDESSDYVDIDNMLCGAEHDVAVIDYSCIRVGDHIMLSKTFEVVRIINFLCDADDGEAYIAYIFPRDVEEVKVVLGILEWREFSKECIPPNERVGITHHSSIYATVSVFEVNDGSYVVASCNRLSSINPDRTRTDDFCP